MDLNTNRFISVVLFYLAADCIRLMMMNYTFQVLDYLGVAEVIDTMEDLAQFLRDISPALSKAAREVCRLTITVFILC